MQTTIIPSHCFTSAELSQTFARQLKKHAPVLASLLPLLAIAGRPASAQVSVPPLGVTPIEVQHATVRPGSRLTDQFIVTNGGSEPMFVSGYTSDWTVGKSGSIEFQEPGTNSQSCASWIQIVPPSFSIPPKGQVVVRYTITTPANLTAEHHALIFFESRPLPAKGKNNMNLLVAARIGCKVFVDPAQALPQGKLTGMGLSPDNKLAVTFQNTGQSHLRANGRLEARDAQGQVVAKADLLPRNVQMLSGTSVDFNPKWDKTLEAGNYTMRVVVDYGGKALAGGEAKVELPVAITPAPPEENKPGAPQSQPPQQAAPDNIRPVSTREADKSVPLPAVVQHP